MKITNTYFCSKEHGTNIIRTNLFDGMVKVINPTDTDYYKWDEVRKACYLRKGADGLRITNFEKNVALTKVYRDRFGMSNNEMVDFLFPTDEPMFTIEETVVEEKEEVIAPTFDVSEMLNVLQSLQKFFSEWHFNPSMRMVNTLTRVSDAKAYCINYFKVMGHSYANEVEEKCSSPEFENMMTYLSGKSTKVVNHRMKVYFGAPGTGKTTQALTESNKCIGCTSTMLPDDLMQVFDFDKGKATFKKSDLWKAMENGTPIVLDEINMLPFESLRFLQVITDDKKSIDFKGNKIEIKDGFKIIGTMNLNVNDTIMSLPEPLVDRCEDIVEYDLSAEQLLRAII